MTDTRQPELSSVRGGYDRWALVYEYDANPRTALEDSHMRKAVGDVRGYAVLDLGCGTGRHTVWLAAAGATVTAVDFSEGMLAEARKKPEAATVTFLTHDFHEPLPFSGGRFDLVISGLVLEHVLGLLDRARVGGSSGRLNTRTHFRSREQVKERNDGDSGQMLHNRALHENPRWQASTIQSSV